MQWIWQNTENKKFDGAIVVVGEDPYPEKGIEANPNEVFLRPWGNEMEWGEWDD